jgi:hypothetical protein
LREGEDVFQGAWKWAETVVLSLGRTVWERPRMPSEVEEAAVMVGVSALAVVSTVPFPVVRDFWREVSEPLAERPLGGE